MAKQSCLKCGAEVSSDSGRCDVCGAISSRPFDPAIPTPPKGALDTLSIGELSKDDLLKQVSERVSREPRRPNQKATLLYVPGEETRGAKSARPAPRTLQLEDGGSIGLDRDAVADENPNAMVSIPGEHARPVTELASVEDGGERRKLTDTSVEGYRPVRVRPESMDNLDRRRRHNSRVRALPFAAVLALVLAALTVAGVDALQRPPELTDDGVAHRPRAILNAGTFTVGLTEDNKETALQACFRLSDNVNSECRRSHLTELGEYPAREVEFGAFEVDRYEVSNANFESCVEVGVCPERDIADCQFRTHRGFQFNLTVPPSMLAASRPAICLTRSEALTYCGWVGGRLPTPDEWERVARGGTDRLAPWGTLWAPNVMNWAETDMGGFTVVGRLDGYELTAPVDRFEDGTTPDDVCNLLGNVNEWVAAVDGRPDGARGGSYTDDLRNVRVTYHREIRSNVRRSDLGFRCIYDL
jgi:formylglycine-generating enzyme required for sulfatase activity